VTITDELVELGHLGGRATTEMLTARWRSTTRQFPVLEPPGGWNDDNRLDMLHEFLCDRLHDLTDALVAVGADEEAVLKVASRIMKNWLIDQARRTDIGAIRLRLEQLLRTEPRFRQLHSRSPRWVLVDTAEVEPGRDDEDSLVGAAMTVTDVKPVRWSDETRRAPMASGPDLVRVLTAVLRCAGSGGLEIGMLTRVFRRRFRTIVTMHVPLDADDTLADRVAAPVTSSTAPGCREAARAVEVYTQLSDRERRILLHLDDRREVEQILQVGRSVAYHHISRLRATLTALAGEDLDVDAVVTELVGLALRDAAPDDGRDATSDPFVTADAKGAQHS
jgi:hypothetical protein